VGQSDFYIERARSALKRRAAQRTLWSSATEAPFEALLGLGFMTFVFGIVPLVLLGGIGLVLGLAASLVYFYFYIEKQKRASLLDLDDWSDWRISERYCESIHPDRDNETWRAMDAIRKNRN
jgi:hypothetical protein